RSGQSRVPSFLRFVNRTTRTVNVTWIDYEGQSMHYKTLSPGCYVDVNTFVGHPWTFQDRDSGDMLVVQCQAVYQPEAWDREKDGWPPRRKLVFISIPVYSLRERCLQIVKKLVPPECIDLLDVPPVLKEELKSS
ncbi:von Hippel-Lindau disease tumor suppressor, partial [Lamellibrachia satsuma]